MTHTHILVSSGFWTLRTCSPAAYFHRCRNQNKTLMRPGSSELVRRSPGRI